MTEINNKSTFDKFEKEKICNLLQSSSLELETIIKNADKISSEDLSIYEIILKILQQGNNVREATLIGFLCGQNLGFEKAKEQIEEDIKQKLFDAFNNRKG
tara:strand:+ start:2449 stop:2751 length:303 start_codon:yes stop_codon:yes gene_type:complete